MKKVCLLLLLVTSNIIFSYCMQSSVLIASRHLFRVGFDLSTSSTGLDSVVTGTQGLDYTTTQTGLDVSTTGTDIGLDAVITTT